MNILTTPLTNPLTEAPSEADPLEEAFGDTPPRRFPDPHERRAAAAQDSAMAAELRQLREYRRNRERQDRELALLVERLLTLEGVEQAMATRTQTVQGGVASGEIVTWTPTVVARVNGRGKVGLWVQTAEGATADEVFAELAERVAGTTA